MPTYEYQCNACDHEFEAFQSITADPLSECPVCFKLELKKLISAGVGILFKGSGFYETDYKRGEAYNKKASQDKKPTETSESKSEKKPAPKQETKNTNGAAN